jgi:hypothetical protein
LDVQRDRKASGWVYGHIDRRIEYRHTDEQKEGGQLCRLTSRQTWISKQADRRMCRHVGISIHRQVVRQKGRRAHTWADRRTDGEMGSCTDGRIDRLAGRQTYRKANGQTGRQSERERQTDGLAERLLGRQTERQKGR